MNHWSTKFLGIPWLTGGRDVTQGLDCWGLLRYVYVVEYGIQLPAYPTEGSLAERGLVMESELSGERWVRTLGPLDGDGVALGRKPGEFEHVGVFVDIDGTPGVLHAARKRASIIQPIEDLLTGGFPEIAFYRNMERELEPFIQC